MYTTGQGFMLALQAGAFSDFRVSGANPVGNAALTDTAFVAGCFCNVQTRVPVAADSG